MLLINIFDWSFSILIPFFSSLVVEQYESIMYQNTELQKEMRKMKMESIKSKLVPAVPLKHLPLVQVVRMRM